MNKLLVTLMEEADGIPLCRVVVFLDDTSADALISSARKFERKSILRIMTRRDAFHLQSFSTLL